MNSTSLEETQNPVSGSCYTRNRVCSADIWTISDSAESTKQKKGAENWETTESLPESRASPTGPSEHGIFLIVLLSLEASQMGNLGLTIIPVSCFAACFDSFP